MTNAIFTFRPFHNNPYQTFGNPVLTCDKIAGTSDEFVSLPNSKLKDVVGTYIRTKANNPTYGGDKISAEKPDALNVTTSEEVS